MFVLPGVGGALPTSLRFSYHHFLLLCTPISTITYHTKSKMYGSKSKPKGTTKKTKSPIRVVVRCAWSGARLTVPTTSNNDDALPPIRASTTTLLDLVLRLESALPPALFQDDSAATLVCLRNTVPQSEWESTKLKQVLEGDDGAAGVVLTLDLGAAGNSANSAPATNAKKSNPVKSAISSAASSLNIKPVVMSSGNVAPAPAPAAALPAASTNNNYPEPMDISNDNTPAAPIHKVMMPEQAWDTILQSNFDATTKDCLNTLLKIIDNILSKPNEPKVRSIRCANAAFEKKVGCCTGGYDFLYSIGFLPKYPAVLGMQSSVASSATPEMLELTPENESKEMLLRGRKVLAQSAVANLGIDEKELPPLPKIPEAIPASSLLAPPSSGSSNSRGQVSGGFNVYKTHSHNIQSAAVGAPDPYKDGSVSKTERQLNQLQSKKSKLEKEMQAQIENDRGLIAYRAGNGPTAFAASTSTAQSGAGGGGGKGDSSLVAARMKRMDEERKKREEGGFTTKAMRDLERMKKAKVCSLTRMYFGMLMQVSSDHVLVLVGIFTRPNSS